MNKTNTINERIKEVRELFVDGSNVKFAEMVGRNPNATSNWVRDGYSVGRGVATIIAEKFGVNMSWLLTGEGEMLKSDSTSHKSMTIPEVEYSNSEALLIKIIESKDAKIEELSKRIGQLEAENRILKEKRSRDTVVSAVDSAVAG